MRQGIDSGRRARRGDGGFTLIEVLFGASILAVAILGITSLAASSARLNRTVEEKDAALRAVDEKVREIQALTYDQVALQDGTGFTVTARDFANNMLRPVTGDADGLPGNVQVFVPNPPNDGNALLQVSVRVDWRGPSGNQSVVRSFFLSRVGQSG